MATITINGVGYFSYASVSSANEYLTPTEYYEVWNTYNDDQKGGYLIQATRYLDMLPWKESCGLTQEEREKNVGIVNACIEIAGRLAAGETDVIGSGSSDGGIQTLKAGSAQISYFQKSSWSIGGGSGSSLTGGLPLSVLALISGCLNNDNSSGNTKRKYAGGIATGVCYPSTAKKSWGYNL